MKLAPALPVLALLVGAAVAPAPAGASGPDAARESVAAPAPYRWMLERFTVVDPLPAGGYVSRFDYGRFAAQGDQADVRSYLDDAFEHVRPDTLSAAERTAWAVNAYNFFVIDAVMEHLVGANGDTLASIADIGAKRFAVFDRPRIRVAGVDYGLDAFEKHFVFGDPDRERRKIPAGLDPRLHFALVCAARGCPALRPGPYTADSLDAELDTAVRNALGNPDRMWLRADTLHVSKIFDWYRPDFDPGGPRDFIYRYAPEPVRRALEAGRVRVIAPDVPWDWRLNRP